MFKKCTKFIQYAIHLLLIEQFILVFRIVLLNGQYCFSTIFKCGFIFSLHELVPNFLVQLTHFRHQTV